MNLETSKKVLKIAGILTIVAAVAAILGGILLLGVGYAGTQMPEYTTDPSIKNGVSAIFIAGAVALVAGIISLIEGIISYKASSNPDLANAAWIFAILGVIAGIVSLISAFMSKNINASEVAGAIGSVLCSVLIFVAAGKVKNNSEAKA